MFDSVPRVRFEVERWMLLNPCTTADWPHFTSAQPTRGGGEREGRVRRARACVLAVGPRHWNEREQPRGGLLRGAEPL